MWLFMPRRSFRSALIVAELKGGGLTFWGSTMSAKLSNEMVAFLLRVLENVENAADEAQISTPRKPADFQDKAKSNAFRATEERRANRFVEQVATAMSKLRDPARGTRLIG
jgi:hypothetical protein